MTLPADRCLVLDYTYRTYRQVAVRAAVRPATAPARDVPQAEVVRVGFRCLLHLEVSLVDVELESGALAQACRACEPELRLVDVVRQIWSRNA